MRRFISAAVLVMMLCVPALCASYDFWAIYDNDKGHIQVYADGNEIREEFYIDKMKVEGSGEIDGNEAVLFLDNGEEVTMTFVKFKNRLVETITVKGYRPFNGTYNAYHGHA